jgi:hypothetical protein
VSDRSLGEASRDRPPVCWRVPAIVAYHRVGVKNNGDDSEPASPWLRRLRCGSIGLVQCDTQMLEGMVMTRLLLLVATVALIGCGRPDGSYQASTPPDRFRPADPPLLPDDPEEQAVRYLDGRAELVRDATRPGNPVVSVYLTSATARNLRQLTNFKNLTSLSLHNGRDLAEQDLKELPP